MTDLTPLSLSTLCAIKVDCLDVIDPRFDASPNVVAAAARVIAAVDAELDRRAQWAADVQTALAAIE